VTSRLTLAVGEPLSPDQASPERLQAIVAELRGGRK
jgi:hypothetical protein